MKNLKPGTLCKLPHRIWGKKGIAKALVYVNRDEIYMYIKSEKVSREIFSEISLKHYHWFLDGCGEKIVFDYHENIEGFRHRHIEVVGMSKDD